MEPHNASNSDNIDRISNAADSELGTTPKLPGWLVQRSQKLSKRDIEEIGSTPLSNYPALSSFLTEVFNTPQGMNLHKARAVASLGKPNVIMRGYESNPGAWVFDDSTGITFVVFSDGMNKKPSKGTYYEAVVPEGTSSKDLMSAVSRLFELVKGACS